jgi:hypothetical protein
MPRTQRKRITFLDRVALRLSTARQVDGLWVGIAFAGKTAEPVFRRVEEALSLIKENDRLRYSRLIRDLERVWVRDTPGALGTFNQVLRACSLDREFVLAETTRPELIAATIVHEATHARLESCGISYQEKLRPRIEAVCFRRERAFATKLPNGEQVRDQAERALATYSKQDFWTNVAFAERFDRDYIEALRKLGAPDWIGQTALTLRAPYQRVRRFLQRVAGLFQSR